MLTLLIVAGITFVLGVAGKYADLVNEHGMKEHFKGAGIASGILWGVSGVAQLIFSPWAGITYVAHILYWFARIKLEYVNHAIAGVMMVLGAFLFRGEFFASHALELIAVFFAYLLSGYLQSMVRNRWPSTTLFWRLRLRIYLVPLLYSLYCGNWEPMAATVGGMIGCEILTNMYKQYWDDLRKTA